MECCKKKYRNEEEKKALITRLNRIEGQIKGIKKMVEEDIYCQDILIQCLAISSALDGFNTLLLENHFKSCISEDLKQGDYTSLEESLKIIRKLMK